MDLSSAREALVEEARELLANMEAALLTMETRGPSRERINALFRAAHTIKGSASLFDLRNIVDFAHSMESVLQRLRAEELALSPGLLTTLLQSRDYLARLIDYTQAERDNEEPDAATRAALLNTLQRYASGSIDPMDLSEQTLVVEKHEEHRNLRVDAAKLDRLIDLVGELVIAAAGARLRAGQQDELLAEMMNEVAQRVHQVREDALALRMLPISEVFQRFRRIVRDLAQSLGKQIDLRITGEETELDKSLVDRLADPLTHLVRNAIDHGIETSEVRSSAGKPSIGRISLHAYHESGYVLIEVSDDGGGLDAERIQQRAVEQGLLRLPRDMTDAMRNELIFEPGFSTSEQISELSGRGVGLDVVRRSIEHLGGQIEVDSETGRGATFRLRLPLTLAIIDGFQVSVNESIFVVPMDAVVECLDLRSLNVAPSDMRGKQVLRVRGELVPYLRLRELFALPPAGRHIHESVVVVRYGQQRVGVVVDELLGEFQSVIKPLGNLFRGTRGLGGSTILPNGDVALILDIPQLLALRKQHETPIAEEEY